jgi:hypothetical protein
MSRQHAPLFLERETYRRRRLMDAARILPVLGMVLFLLPALWRRAGDPNTAAESLYLFAVWGMLILAAGLLARPLRRTDAPRRAAPPLAPPSPADPPAADAAAASASAGAAASAPPSGASSPPSAAPADDAARRPPDPPPGRAP